MPKHDVLVHDPGEAPRGGAPRVGDEGTLIALAHDDEVREWAARLGCSEHELREAVSVVGHSADEVRRYLSYRRH